MFSTVIPNSRKGANGEIHVVERPNTHEEHMTAYSNLLAGAAIENGSRALFGQRKVDPETGAVGDYEWITYADVVEKTSWLATAMASELKIQRQECVGVFSKNRVEWVLVEHAANRMAYTLVPLYDTLGPQAVPFILNQTQMRVVFCGQQQLKTLLSCLNKCTHLETIVVFDEMDDAAVMQLDASHVRALTMTQLVDDIKAARTESVPADPPTPDDLVTISYTSGTTGDPKGAMLTHRNAMFAACCISVTEPVFASDVHLSYLPLAHLYERLAQFTLISKGGAIGFYQGDIMKILDDLYALRPTVFPSVPRLLNRVHDRIKMKVANGSTFGQYAFDQAYASKKYYFDNGGHLTHRFWDALVFGKVKEALGGRVRAFISASAPITAEIKEFYQLVFGCPMFECYGLTETAAVATAATYTMPTGNHVGAPYPGVQVRLQDVPDMNYTSEDKPRPRGEVLVKGPCVFKGYYNAPEQTAEMIDADGWLHTGDIGAWNADGTLSIIDRKKNIFKLSQGEYVAPEKIEGVYQQSAFVQQVFVHGDSLQSFLVGVVVPDSDAVKQWQQENGKTDVSLAELCANDADFKDAVTRDMQAFAKQNGLHGFEMVKKLHLHPEQFTIEQDLLTPTFKLKRPQLRRHFQQQIDAMYAGLAIACTLTMHCFQVPNSRSGARGTIYIAKEPCGEAPAATLYENLARSAELHGHRQLYGTRSVDPVTGVAGAYEWVTSKREESVGVFAKNCLNWNLVEHAANRMTYTLVPLYDTLGPQAVPFILNQTEVRIVFCGKEQLKTLRECVHDCTHIEQIVTFDPLEEADKAAFSAKNVQVWNLEELIAKAKTSRTAPVPADAPKPDDLCTICYTSGTTGDPKGAMLTHANLIAGANSVRQKILPEIDDVHMSYLPLAHVFERAAQVGFIMGGASVTYFQGDVLRLTDDIANAKPTIFASVPRLLNRIYDKVTMGVSNAPTIKRVLFEQAYASKKYYLDNGGHLTHRLWDPLVFDKIKAALGGNLRSITSGSAPLATEVKEFYQIVFGCPLNEGYGLTESSAAGSASVGLPLGDHVGVPFPGIQMRLQDVPDMNYTNDDVPRPRGEILIKGPNVFKGYYKAPELTAEALDADGWLHTGDIGAWNADGTLSIIDRKKNIFKLSQGEYVAPEKIENVYQQSPFVQQVFVYGESLQSYLVGVVVPDPDAVKNWQQETGMSGMSLSKLCADSAELKEAIAKDMLEKAKANKLFGFEMVKKLHLHADVFSVEKGLVTPTFKLKRPQLQKHFQSQIDAMYAEH
ncbi:TPA: hypothetical protein N0F65_010120 [Lagenidium giganteum]|uniref:Long-chain-fatty-acid--CoA ligase n=1 Tax=Lagenidium giganteum TaxID=4803 RepID=A0AAV2YJ96_9STRA|nr:TPA: hypothetical protein N0F65_010120 [Lagenidium giganteum]